MQRRLEAQLEEIRGSQAIHERFTSLALAGAGPGAILEAIAALRGARVELFDPAGFRLERAGKTPTGDALGISRLDIPTSISQRRARGAGGDHRGQAGAGADPDPDPSRRRAASGCWRQTPPRWSTPTAAGRWSTAPPSWHWSWPKSARRPRSSAASAATSSRSCWGTPWSVMSTPVSPARPSASATASRRESWVMVVEPDGEAAAQALESGSMQDRLHRLVSDLVTRRFAQSLVVTRSASLVLVIPVAEAEDEAPPPAAELRTREARRPDPVINPSRGS